MASTAIYAMRHAVCPRAKAMRSRIDWEAAPRRTVRAMAC